MFRSEFEQSSLQLLNIMFVEQKKMLTFKMTFGKMYEKW